MTIRRAEVPRTYTTVMDAEVLAVAVRWDIGGTGKTDRQVAIRRIQSLQLPPVGGVDAREGRRDGPEGSKDIGVGQMA